MHIDRSVPTRQYNRIIAEQGILYPFLLQSYRDVREGKDTRGTTVGGFTSNRYSAPAEGANAPKVWRGDPDAPIWNPARPGETTSQRAALQMLAEKQSSRHSAQPTSTQRYPASERNSQAPADVPRHLQSTYASFAPPARRQPQYSEPAAASSSSSSVPAGVPALELAPNGRPKTPVLHLDLQTAKTLKPQYLQDIGSCVWTNGVDPAVKYRHPLTTSHQVGWAIQNRTLEFFGSHAQAARSLSASALYGWQ